MLDVKRTSPQRSAPGLLDHFPIVGMDGAQEVLISRRLGLSQTEDVEDLVRTGKAVGGNVQQPASNVRNALRLPQIGLALTQRRLGLLLLRDVPGSGKHAGHLARFVPVYRCAV